MYLPGRRGPQLRGAVRPLPPGKDTGSLSQSPDDRLSLPQGVRRGAPQLPAAPPSSCHHSPALQRLTFEFVIGFGLFVKLLPDFEIRHDPRFRLHGSRFPSFHCLKVRTEPGGGGKVAGPGSPERCAPAQCPAQPARPLAAARPGAGEFTLAPGREGRAAARCLGSVVRPGRGVPGSPGEPLPRKLQLPEGQAGAEATWWTPLLQLLFGFIVNVSSSSPSSLPTCFKGTDLAI